MSDVADWDVIIVDDEPDNIGVVQLVFDFQDISLRSAESGKQCIQLLEDRLPTLLLVDIQMPEMSGYELLEYIQANYASGKMIIIAMTAYAMEEDARKASESGFDGYIPKPIDVVKLIDQIQAIVDEKRD